MKYNYKVTLSFDGSKYSGWQRNANANDTIQSKCDEIFSKYFDEKVNVIGAGRTDKGVHAKAMVASFIVSEKLDIDLAVQELNHYLPQDIVIISIEEADERFHARFHAKSKCYTYTYAKGYRGVKPLFDRLYVDVLEEKVDVELMRKAARLFVGEHDFKGFSSDKTKKSTVREIMDIIIVDEEDYIKISFIGNGFLYNMVRILTGTLIEIGTGKRKMNSINYIFKTMKRSDAGFLAKAHGLSLDEVKYE